MLGPRLVPEPERSPLADRAHPGRDSRPPSRAASALFMLGRSLDDARRLHALSQLAVHGAARRPRRWHLVARAYHRVGHPSAGGSPAPRARGSPWFQGEPAAIMRLEEQCAIDTLCECPQVFGTTDAAHPDAAKVPVIWRGGWRCCRTAAAAAAMRVCIPEEPRQQFVARRWNRVAALPTRRPLHRSHGSHEFLAKIAREVCGGLLMLGGLKPADVPAKVRMPVVSRLVAHYFAPAP